MTPSKQVGGTFALDQSSPGVSNLVASNQIFGPVVGTLSKVGDVVTLPPLTAGMGTYFIAVTTAPGDAPFIGSFASTDSVLGSGRRLIKTGVGPLQVSTVTLNGTQGALDYRTTGGPGTQKVTCTGWTSGRATITLYAITEATAPFINGAIDTPQRAALLSGRAFTSSAMAQVAGASLFNILFVNKGSSGIRAIFDDRRLATDNPTGMIASKYYSLANPTINLPTQAAAARNRANFGPTSAAISVFFGTSTASATADGGGGFPDQTPSVPLASRIGGILPTGGRFGGPEDIEAIVDPGSSVVYSILAVANSGGLSSINPFLSGLITWTEEPLY